MHQTKKCTNCSMQINFQAVKCKHCDTHVGYSGLREKKWNKMTALLLTIIPGLGHVYKKKVFQGLMWFICTVLAYKFILLPGFLFHFVCAYTAYSGNEYK